jgi:hypothetical protein
MHRIYLILFDFLMLLLLGFCLRDAWQKGKAVVWQLIAGVFYGWLLEWATIVQFEAYQYGDFLLKVGPVPLSIGIGWGVII